MSICGQVTQAASGFFQSPIVQGLGQALNALSAADIAIRAATGNQTNVWELPSLLTGTAGIPCYSPELGDTIYITPAQWYANGMKCNGLRDTNREEIQRRIQEYQDQMDARNRIRRRGFTPPPMNARELQSLERLLPQLPGGFAGGTGIEFLVAGILTIKKWSGLAGFSQWCAYGGPIATVPHSSQSNILTSVANITPGTQIRPTSGTSSTYTLPYFDEIEGYSFSKTVTDRSQWYQLVIAGASIGTTLMGFSDHTDSTSQRPSIRNSYQALGGYGAQYTNASYGFTPSSSAPPTNNGGGGSNTPINPSPPPQPPQETPCMGGCSCSQMAMQAQQQNSKIEKMIKEIHQTLNAGLFASGGYAFAPEQLIERQGKTIYGSTFGRGGIIRVSNFLEAITAAVSAHYHRSGLHRFPAIVPDSLIPKLNDQLEAVDIDFTTLHDAMAWQKWWFEQWDAATGEYPIKYEITDDGKTKPVRLWNQSEVMAEMFGMLCKIQEDADLGVQWGVRAATEASKSGNAALKGLHLLQEYVKWSGCLTSNGAKDFIKVTCTFSPDPGADPTKAEEMLKPSTQDLQITNIVDGRSLLGILMNINYWTQVSGRANFGDMGAANPLVQSPGQNMNMPGDGIKEMRKKERAQNKIWDKWKQEQEAPSTIPQSQQPPGGIPQSNIIEIERKKK